MNVCSGCGELVTDLDAGFSPGLHHMGHDCGGTWCKLRAMNARPTRTDVAGAKDVLIQLDQIEGYVTLVRGGDTWHAYGNEPAHWISGTLLDWLQSREWLPSEYRKILNEIEAAAAELC